GRRSRCLNGSMPPCARRSPTPEIQKSYARSGVAAYPEAQRSITAATAYVQAELAFWARSCARTASRSSEMALTCARSASRARRRPVEDLLPIEDKRFEQACETRHRGKRRQPV